MNLYGGKEIIAKNKFLFTVLLISFILRLFFMSPYLDCWDSVQFAMGLSDYSISNHTPHPPGFPIYIFLGRLVNTFINNTPKSLTFISALFGTFSLVPTYLLGKRFFNENVAALAIILLSFNSTHFLFSEIVMSDIVNMFFIVTAVYFLYEGVESRKSFYTAGFILGLSAGIRPTDTILLAPLCLVVMTKKRLKENLIFMGIGLVTVIFWAVPLIIDTGLGIYLELLNGHWTYNEAISTFYSSGGFTLTGITTTARALMNLFLDGWTQGLLPLVFLTVLVAGTSRTANFRSYLSDLRFIFASFWLTPVLLFSFFNYILYTPRYLLPVFPLLSIVFSYSILETISLTQKIRLTQKIHLDKIISILFLLLIAFMGYQAMAGAYNIHNTVPAPVQTANFIEANYDPDHTVILVGDSGRHFEYYLQDFEIGPVEDESFIQTTIEALQDNNTVLSETAYSLLFDSSDVKFFDFNRDYKIYPKHSSVKLCEYKPVAQGSSVIFAGKGFYNFEQWDGVPTRRMDADAELFISCGENYTGTLSFKTLSYDGSKTLVIYSENNMIFKGKVSSEPVTFDVPVSFDAGITRLELHVLEGAGRPSDTQQGEDPGYLNIALQDIKIQST